MGRIYNACIKWVVICDIYINQLHLSALGKQDNSHSNSPPFYLVVSTQGAQALRHGSTIASMVCSPGTYLSPAPGQASKANSPLPEVPKGLEVTAEGQMCGVGNAEGPMKAC